MNVADEMRVALIRITQLTPQEKQAKQLYQVLTHVLSLPGHEKEYLDSVTMKADDGSTDVFCFTAPLSLNKDSNRPYVSYHVLGNGIQKGGGSEIQAVLGRIILMKEAETCFYVPGSHQVIKEFKIDENIAIETQKQEFDDELLALKALGLPVKNYHRDADSPMFTLRRIKGVDLAVYLFEETEKKPLTIYETIDLSLAVLDAYDKQLFAKKYLHCDIKPENIMISRKKTGGYRATFIDFAFSLPLIGNTTSVIYKKIRGSIEYIDPRLAEAVLKDQSAPMIYDIHSDLWALNLVLLAIWDVKNPLMEFSSDHKMDYFSNIVSNAREGYYSHALKEAEHDWIPKQIKMLFIKSTGFYQAQRLSWPEMRARWQAAVEQVLVNQLKKTAQPSHSHHNKRRLASKKEQINRCIEALDQSNFGVGREMADIRREKLVKCLEKRKISKTCLNKQKMWVEALALFATPKTAVIEAPPIAQATNKKRPLK